MLVTPVDGDVLAARETAALERVLSLLEGVPAGLSVGDGSWTVREVAGHLVTVVRRYLSPDTRLASSPREVDDVNRDQLAELSGASVDELTAALRGAATAYQRAWSQFPLDRELPFHAGARLDVASLRTNWIGELLVHGRDVAVAAGQTWPLEEVDALLLVRFLLRVLPAYLRATDLADTTVGVRPAGGRPASIVVQGGRARVDDGDGPSTASASAPAEVLALLLYSRMELGDAEAAGLRVSGDRAAIEAVLGAIEPP